MINFKTKFETKYFKQNFKNVNRTFQDIPVSDIEIEIEQLILPISSKNSLIMERPVKVSGVIIPTQTKGRKSTPDPVAFDSLASQIKSVTKTKLFAYLAENSDRGHIMALQMGTPNSKYNIVPQWNGFQEYGDWRRLEKLFIKLATKLLENNNSLFCNIDVEYLNVNMSHLGLQLKKLFNIEYIEGMKDEQIRKVLQIFGTPTSYYYSTYPCSIYVKKPLKFSLSIPYIRHLYDHSVKVSKNSKAILKKSDNHQFPNKILPQDLISINDELIHNINSYIHEGTIALSTITEEDVC